MDRQDPIDHEVFMRRCIDLAAIARNEGNTPVGSIVVLEGEIVGEAVEALPAGTSITGHAEVLACQAALDRAGRRDLAGAVLTPRRNRASCVPTSSGSSGSAGSSTARRRP